MSFKKQLLKNLTNIEQNHREAWVKWMSRFFFNKGVSLEYFLLSAVCFVCGAFFGDRLRKVKWGMLDWQLLKWNPDTFSYRITNIDAKVKKDEKVLIALKVDTEFLDHGDGIQLFDIEEK